MIDFDQQLDGFADAEVVPDDVIPAKGLIVDEPAAHGNDLVLLSQVYMDSTKGLPFVLFIEGSDDDPNAERWANAEEFRVAMDRLTLPTEQEAHDWVNTRIAERLEKWKPQLEEAGLLAEIGL
jgi:hypothetical protein